MTAPYYTDAAVTLFHGRMEDVLPGLGQFDLCCTDPPYQETSLAWDRWPAGWPALAAQHTDSMWCFGSMRMFLERRDEFNGWKLSQDVVWEKPNGSMFAVDRFKRVHETVAHWYRGPWSGISHAVPREPSYGPSKTVPMRKQAKQRHTGAIGDVTYTDDGTRMLRSVLRVRNMHHRAIHPTEKPLGILDPLITYACPPGGIVLDCFAGSGSTLVAARASGRSAVGIEADERYVEAIARRLDQAELGFEGVS